MIRTYGSSLSGRWIRPASNPSNPNESPLQGLGISPVIPSKSNQRRQPHFDRAAYRLRNRVERLINRLKQFRRIATRYEKRAANYLAMLTIGMILLWI